jgi:hypothetical protein
VKAGIFAAIICGVGVLCSSGQSQAAGDCSLILMDKQDSFYGALWGCQQSRINDMWSRFHMTKVQWPTGFWGYDDPCNDSKPLKRTFNALQLLAYGVTNNPTCDTSVTNMGKWAYCWAGGSINQLTSSCSSASRAYSTWPQGSTELRVPFFRDETVAQRAGTIVHEARHTSGYCVHDSLPCAGIECEPAFTTNGCVGLGASSGYGAYGYQAIYLTWFASSAQASWINASIREDAVAEANRIFEKNFTQGTCWRLASNGVMYDTCPPPAIDIDQRHVRLAHGRVECLTGSTTVGVQVSETSCNFGTANETWTLVPLASGGYNVKAGLGGPGLCLNVHPTLWNANVTMDTCGLSTAKFEVVGALDGLFKLKSGTNCVTANNNTELPVSMYGRPCTQQEDQNQLLWLD